jgi:epoxyqueuosine reductase
MTNAEDSLVATTVLSRLEGPGCKARIVSVKHLAELKGEIERNHSEGLIDDGVYCDYSYAFNSEVPEALAQARSIIIVASPVPAEVATFTVNGRTLQAVIPPTYNHSTDQQACDLITEVLKPKGYRLISAGIPKKLTATRSGLAKYGKNNVTYMEGMGSYYRLAAFYTDAPISEDHWQKPDMLDRCKTCTACVKKCPSGAISSDRFLLHAEKCITYHNESEKPFPEWIDPSWHNCLIGCMICQDVCPENPKSVRRTLHVATFTEEETKQILASVPKNDLDPKTVAKLSRIYPPDDYSLLSRNLAALLVRE